MYAGDEFYDDSVTHDPKADVVMDYPQAFAYLATTALGDHDRRCSYREGMLCDCSVIWREYGRREARAEAEAEVERLRAALGGLLDYPYVMDGYGCRGCGRDVAHDESCPVGKALAVWSEATMGEAPALAPAATPAPPAPGEGDRLCAKCGVKSGVHQYVRNHPFQPEPAP